MTKYTVAFTALAFVWLCSCKKNNASIVAISIPINEDSVMTIDSGIVVMGATFVNSYGVLMYDTTSGNLKDISGNSIKYNRSWVYAAFVTNSSDIPSNAGTVLVNGTNILPYGGTSAYTNYFYKNTNASQFWKDTGINIWNVSGSSQSPGINYKVDNTGMPIFKGTLPTHISTGTDLTFTPDSSNISTSTGSLFIYPYKSYIVMYSKGNILFSTTADNGGTVIIKASELKKMSNATMPLSGYFFPAVSNPAVFYGGFMAVVLYAQTPFKVGGKTYYFVSQNVTLGNVVFTP